MGLVILLDQVSRNTHRGSPLAFAGDAKALALAKASVGRGYHQKLVPPLAMWLLMPFEHAEDLDAQNRCVALFGTLGLHDMVYYAQMHLDIIARFGRFPHRNRGSRAKINRSGNRLPASGRLRRLGNYSLV